MRHKLKVPIYFSLLLFFTSLGFAQITNYDTIKVDLGSYESDGTWNNINAADGVGEVLSLINSRNLYTAMSVSIYDRFNGINTGGTTSPDAGLTYPASATRDSYFGNTVEFAGFTEPTGGLLFSGLNPAKQYTFEVFASRTATDNREAKYKFTGTTVDSVLLNPSNNTANTVSLTMQPKQDGTIDLLVSPGPNNDNGSGFYYLGAIKMIYEEEDVLPPAIALTTPNGAEELTGETNYFITWEAINLLDDVVVSYSTNNGASWNEIVTVDSSQTSLSWSVPNTSSSECLVQVVSGSVSDQSDAVFTIVPATGIVYDTVKVDFGSYESEGTWNNINGSDGVGEITSLLNSRNLYTAMGINIYDRFTGINTGGTASPDANLGYPVNATRDSYYGNTAEWAGLTEPTGALVITGLNPDKEYTFEVFASRSATDNREAKYKFTGATTDSVLLNPSNNTSNTVSLTMQPDVNGTVDLVVSPGPNNDNGSGFYYLGAIKMIYEEEDVLPPAIALTAPNGGEELTGQASYNITWDGRNLEEDVVVSYSTNDGASWIEIATVDKAQSSVSWSVANVTSDACLVQVVSGMVSDQSDSAFTIIPASGTVYDTVMVDFGSELTATNWNNLNNSDGTGEILSLINSKNLYTAMSINIYDRFNGINTGGTIEPDANSGYPADVTRDSYFGNVTEFSGLIEPTGAMLISGLNPEKQYTFEVFASRLASDNREAKYKFTGAVMDSVLLNPSNNTENSVSVTMQPKEDGTVDLVVSPGPNNDNSYGFYYLGALKLIYEEEDVLPPAITVTAPNGGEELSGDANFYVSWEPVNLLDDVTVSFSANNGTSWEQIATVDKSETILAWTVPNITSTECLVQVVSGSASDQSDSLFTITPSSSTVNDTVLVDFGSNESGEGWNNFIETTGDGEIPALMTSQNAFSGLSCSIFDRFNGINYNGTTSPDPNLNLSSTATNDSYYGNTAVWAGLVEPTAGLFFSGMNPSKEYTFEIFASRMGVSDNRETKYKFVGTSTDSVYLNPANNQSEIATISVQPAEDGSLELLVSAGENNNNSYNFYYLTALKIIYEHEESSASVVVTSPNGGEEWTRNTEQEIGWASSGVNNVKIEYSADNGSSWDTVATVAASASKYTWMVPDVKTDSALVKISAVENPSISDVSNRVFKIDNPLTGDYRPLIVVLGSSTAAGTGATTSDSAWVWRYRSYVQDLDKEAYVVNLAIGGYTSYDIMPSDFIPPSGRPAPKTENNVTKALTYKPSAIIINLPSNDASNGYTVTEQVFNMRTITQTATDADVPVWVTTTQPRNFSQTQRDNLMEMRDSILTIYGDHAVSIFDELANSDGTIKTIYNSGDGVHLNNAGHKVISDAVIEVGVWEAITTDIPDQVSNIPTDYAISRNYPNPFNPSTTIDFSLPVYSEIDVRIYDITGKQVAVLAIGKYAAGNYHVVWDASNLASGMYIYRIIARGNDNTRFTKSMKMMFIK